jgi:hypothetical protein
VLRFLPLDLDHLRLGYSGVLLQIGENLSLLDELKLLGVPDQYKD